ncbi:MAG: hypothetical protein GH155_07470 [Spirochaeta sp.]|nr:hypothetical protein [Spirochaeta sp.]
MLDNSVAFEKLVVTFTGRKRLQRLKCYCVDGGFYGLLFFLLITLARIFWPIKVLPVNNYLWELGLVFTAAVIFAAAWALARRIDRQQLLISADRRLELQERLSTANEYLEKEGNNPLSPLLIGDAVARARNIEKSPLYKAEYPGRLKYYPLLLAGILLLSILKPGLATTDEFIDLGQRIESSSRLLAARAGEKSLEDSLFEEMRRFGEELQKGSMTEQEALERADEMAELLQQRIENLERSSLPAEQDKSADAQELSRNESGVSELEKELLDFQTIYLQERSESELMQSKPEELEQAEGIAEIEDLSAVRELLKNFMSAQKTEEGFSAPSDSTAADSSEEAGEDSPEQNRTASGVGNEKVEDQRDTAKPLLKSSEQGISRVEGTADWEESKKIFLRSLPPGGESIIPDGRKLIDFRREIEEVIRKEEVPLNYREYIKNYFLKINIIQD